MTELGRRMWNVLPQGSVSQAFEPPSDDALTIALVNNMPDGALQATERQFCRLLTAASNGIVVRLKFYSPPCLSRSAAARQHISRYYEDFDELERSSHDGLIVTGSEPRSELLEDEPSWSSISRLADWAEDSAMPVIWSCLAGHIAVFHMDGIHRRRLAQKASGVFECRVNTRAHPVLPGLPVEWVVPHSRLNGLQEDDLVTHGYTILSRSREVGVDVFHRHHGALQLFFQGHPEYEATTLLCEYRRDVKRYLAGEAAVFPRVPKGCIDVVDADRLKPFRLLAERRSDPGLLAELDNLIAQAPTESLGLSPARRIYFSWLSYLHRRRRKQMRGYLQLPPVPTQSTCDVQHVSSAAPHPISMIGTNS